MFKGKCEKCCILLGKLRVVQLDVNIQPVSMHFYYLFRIAFDVKTFEQ